MFPERIPYDKIRVMFAVLACLLSQSKDAFDAGPKPLLMRHPTVSASKIAFQFAGEIWEVPRNGGEAIRLTASGGKDGNPIYSPDGKLIAFSGSYDGNIDVYVMPTEGGVPKRLTSHPSPDVPVAWTPDGKSVIFTSTMLSNTDYPRLLSVPVTGGIPTGLPFPSGTEGSFSPDGKQIAYVPTSKWQPGWKRYRGGQTAPVWIANLADSKVHAIPRNNTDDHNPLWVGNFIYYLSDPEGPVGMFRYDLASGKEQTVIPGNGFDIKFASAGPGAIVYEKLGSLWLYDLAEHQSREVHVSIHGDFTEARTELKDVSRSIHSIAISPTGKRLVAEARGWIFTIPAKKGDVHLLEGPQGLHRHDPAWSPDGKSIAYITDQGGGESLAIYDLDSSAEQRFPLGDPPATYNHLTWSPDGKRIAYTDNRLKLWSFDVASKKSTLVDQGSYRGRVTIEPKWSPDSNWLTWSRDLISHVTVVYVYSFTTGKKTQITDGLAQVSSPAFDRNGKQLYFLASTDTGLGVDFEDVSTFNAHDITNSAYAVVLAKDLPNPLQPESDEESTTAHPETPKKDAPLKVSIDFDNIEHRIIALPIPAGDYSDIEPGPAGSLFIIGQERRGPSTIHKFNFSDRKLTTFAEGPTGIQVSADGNQALLYPGSTSIVATAGAVKGEGSPINLTGLQVKIDMRSEWNAMFHEVWRNERVLLYDPAVHGLDTFKIERRYEPFLSGIETREDLNYLFTDMIGEICIGHMWARGGDIPTAKQVAGGLLGADFTFDNHRYRFAKIYDGERWNPELYAPLAQPGVDAKVGDYLLAVEGHPLLDATDLYETLEGKAGKQVKLKIGPSADGKGARDVNVVPVASEFELRQRSWEEDNRRLVGQMTGGHAGYVHVPDTGGGGWRAFNRYYYAQADKTGMIVDDRFNHGGLINDWMVREMEKPLDFMSHTRYGEEIKIPVAAVYGPKVMLVNELAGSGGDIFPYLFKQDKVGALVGKRTWGAMLSAFGFQLIDGGSVNAPDDAMYNPRTGKWIIENTGTSPDIEVDLDPALWRHGRDSQLEAAIAELKKQMAAHPSQKYKAPPYPNKSKIPAVGNGV